MALRFDLLALPAPGDLQALWKSLERQTEVEFRLFVPTSAGSLPADPRWVPLSIDDDTPAGDLLNRFFALATAPFLGLIPTNCELLPGALATIDRRFPVAERRRVGVYRPMKFPRRGAIRQMPLIDDRGDITEREDRYAMPLDQC